MKRWIGGLGCVVASLGVQAGEVYGGVGVPGLMLGFAQPVSANVTVRADFSTLGSRTADGTEEGIQYAGTLKTNRVGAYADWFPGAGGFRLTGGLTFNRFGLDLTARPGAGQSITIGDVTYPVLAADDRLDVSVKFPDTTPYIGIGYGHRLGKGWGFVADLGVSIGKPKVTAVASGTTLGSDAGIQAEVDKEIAELRNGVGKVTVLPQLSVALSYSF